MTALNEHDQAQYVGIRSTFYKLATIFAEGLLLMYIGSWEVITKKCHGRMEYRSWNYCRTSHVNDSLSFVYTSKD